MLTITMRFMWLSYCRDEKISRFQQKCKASEADPVCVVRVFWQVVRLVYVSSV